MASVKTITAVNGSGQLPQYTPEQIAAILAENNRLREQATKRNTLSFKVSDKGAVSVYGLSARFPVTLYESQWERLLAVGDDLKAFIKANRDKLARKDGGA